MADATSFLTVMSALSASTQTLVDHLIKGRSRWLDDDKPNRDEEGRRFFAIHAISGVIGAFLAWLVNLNVFKYLDLQVNAGPWAEYLAAGILVSFGGSFFNEALDSVREFKKAQARS